MSKPPDSTLPGSVNDWEVMPQVAWQQKDFGVACDARVISAQRSPAPLFDYSREVREPLIKPHMAAHSVLRDGLQGARGRGDRRQDHAACPLKIQAGE